VLVEGSLLQMQPTAGTPMTDQLIAIDLISQSIPPTTRTLFEKTDAAGRYAIRFREIASGTYQVNGFFAGTSDVQMQECGPHEIVVP
jgi:hypothetical protein